MKRFLLLIVLVSIAPFTFSQKISVSVFGGSANYEGDLQDKFFTFSQPRFAAGGGLLYRLSDNLFIRTGVTFASVTADDKKNSKVAFRNLNFTSPITEFQLGLEYNLFNLNESMYTPYFFGGMAIYHFNPWTRDTSGTKYYLQPLSTEGEGFYMGRVPYSLTQFAIPFGGGIKWALSDKIIIGIEVGMRKLFTDYLDDVSTTYVDPNLLLANRGEKAVELAFRGGELGTGETYPTGNLKRGEPKNKDWYYFTGITFTYRLPSNGEIDDRVNKSGRVKKFKTGCPKPVY